MICSIGKLSGRKILVTPVAAAIDGDVLAFRLRGCRNGGKNGRVEKPEPLHLAGRAFWQLFQEVNSRGSFEMAKPSLAEGK